MTRRPSRHRFRPGSSALEPRRPPAAGALAAASALYASPLAAAARTAALAYQAGQFVYNGHTSFLLGAVTVSQPYALRTVVGRHPHRGHPAPDPGPAVVRVEFGRPHLPSLKTLFPGHTPGRHAAQADHPAHPAIVRPTTRHAAVVKGGP